MPLGSGIITQGILRESNSKSEFAPALATQTEVMLSASLILNKNSVWKYPFLFLSLFLLLQQEMIRESDELYQTISVIRQVLHELLYLWQ